MVVDSVAELFSVLQPVGPTVHSPDHRQAKDLKSQVKKLEGMREKFRKFRHNNPGSEWTREFQKMNKSVLLKFSSVLHERSMPS